MHRGAVGAVLQVDDRGGALHAAAALRSDGENAAQFAGAVDALREGEGIEIDTVDRRLWENQLQQARERIGESAFKNAWRRGRYADRRTLLEVS